MSRETAPVQEPQDQRALLREGERLDDLQLGGLKLIQSDRVFRFGMDAVLLADYAQAGKGAQVLDLCCGSGIVPILMSARQSDAHYTGLEIDPRAVDLAERSIRYNGLDTITMIQGDIREADLIFGAASFDVVTCNPPYMIGGHGRTGPDPYRTAARHELWCTFRDVTAAASRLLKMSGHLYLVHRPFRMTEILTELRDAKLEPKRMRLVCPFADREPNLMLIDAVKGGRPRVTVEPPLIVYERPGTYTPEIRRIYGME